MEQHPTGDDGRRALMDHALERAHMARSKYGPVIDAAAILRILDDRTIVRYPVGIRFDTEGLRPGELAHAEPLGEHPRSGFCLFLHPALQLRPDVQPLVIAYHIPPINYGDITEIEDCEAFGAALLGLSVEMYYQQLCAVADSIVPAGGA